MVARQVYSCDWCEVDSPRPGFIGDRWSNSQDPSGKDIHLCPTCTQERADIIASARERRRPK